MRVWVDNEAADLMLSPGGTLSELIQAARTTLVRPPRMISSVRIDGVELTGEELEKQLGEAILPGANIALETSSAIQLVDEALWQATDILEDSRADCARIVDLLSSSKTQEAMIVLGQVLRQWQQIHQGVTDSIKMLGMDLTRLIADGESASTVFEQVIGLLHQFREVVGAQDTVLLADILQYETEPVLARWRRSIEAIREQATAVA